MGLLSWLGGKKSGGAEPAAPSSARSIGEHAKAEDKEPAEDDANGESASRLGLDELTRMLESRSGAARVDAVRTLLDRWRGLDAEAAAVLAPRVDALLEDDEAVVRQSALSAVRLMRKPENLARVQSAVLARLADGMAPVRTAAVWAAAHLPGEIPRAQVLAQLESAEETMRFSAACALADRQDSAAIPVLLAAMEENHSRQEALTALMALGDAQVVAPIAELFEGERLGAFDRTLAAAALARFGDARGTAHLIERIEAAGDDQPIAAEWAGRVGAKEAAPALFAVADEEGSLARGAALRALGRLHAEGAWEKLSALARDEDAAEDLRMDAAEGIAELGTPEARALLEALRAEEGELGSLCGELLFELAASEAEPAAAAPAEKTQGR